MSHPSLIEIEPTTSEFTLKYNNSGQVEDIITINPVDKTIDGNSITLKNFTYTDMNIEESKIKNLKMENLTVDGKFTYNSFVPGFEYVGSGNNLEANLGNQIKLSTYKKWADDDTGSTLPTDTLAKFSNLVYVSPDGEYKIVSELLEGWSHNIPKLYLLKLNSTTKKFDVKYELSEKIAYRYRKSLPLPDGESEANTTNTLYGTATRCFGGINVDGANTYNAYQAYYNSSWTVDAMADSTGNYTKLVVIHKFDYKASPSGNPTKTVLINATGPVNAGCYDIYVNKDITTLGNTECPHSTRMFIFELKSDYSDIAEAVLTSGETCQTSNNDKYSSMLQCHLFNDNKYSSVDSTNNDIEKLANPNTIYNFVLKPENYNHGTITGNFNNDLYINGFTTSNVTTYDAILDNLNMRTLDSPTFSYNNIFKLDNIIFGAGGYSGIKIITNSDGGYIYGQLFIPFYTPYYYLNIGTSTYNTAPSANMYIPYICDYRLTFNITKNSGITSNTDSIFIYPSHNIKFNSRTNIGSLGMQLNVKHRNDNNWQLDAANTINENVEYQRFTIDITDINFGIVIRESLDTSYIEDVAGTVNSISDYVIFAHINSYEMNNSRSGDTFTKSAQAGVYVYKYHLRFKVGTALADWLSEPNGQVGTFNSGMINKNQLMLEAIDLTVDSNILGKNSNAYTTDHFTFNNDDIVSEIAATNNSFDSYFTNISVDEKLRYFAIGNSEYTPDNTDSENKHQGKVTIFKLNSTYAEYTTQQNVERGITFKKLDNLSTAANATSGLYSSESGGYRFFNIDSVPSIKNADIECDKLAYAHIGSKVQVNSVLNTDTNLYETYVIVGIPGDQTHTVSTSGTSDTTDYKGSIVIYQLQNSYETENKSGVMFNEKFVIPATEMAYSDSTLYEFGKNFYTTYNLSKLFVSMDTLSNTSIIKEISFDKKFSVVGDSTYYNTSNHFFRNTVRFSGNLIQDSGTANFKSLTVDDLAFDTFKTALIYVGRAKQYYDTTKTQYEISIATSIIESNTTDLELEQNNAAVTDTTGKLTVADIYNTVGDTNTYKLATISRNKKYAVVTTISNSEYPTLTLWSLNDGSAHKKCITLNNAIFKTVVHDSININTDTNGLNSTASNPNRQWCAVTDISDRYVFLALDFNFNTTSTNNDLARFFVLKLNDTFDSLDSSFNIKPFRFPNTNEPFIYNRITNSSDILSFTNGDNVYFTTSTNHTTNHLSCGYVFSVNNQTEDIRTVDVFLPTNNSIKRVHVSGYSKDNNAYLLFYQSDMTRNDVDTPLAILFKYNPNTGYERFNTPYRFTDTGSFTRKLDMIPFNNFSNTTTWYNVNDTAMTSSDYIGNNLDQYHIFFYKNINYPASLQTSHSDFYNAKISVDDNLTNLKNSGYLLRNLQISDHNKLYFTFKSDNHDKTQLFIYNPQAYDSELTTPTLFNYDTQTTNATTSNLEYTVLNPTYTDLLVIRDTTVSDYELIDIKSNESLSKFLVLKMTHDESNNHIFALDGYSLNNGSIIKKISDISLDNNTNTVYYESMYTKDDLNVTMFEITNNANSILQLATVNISAAETKLTLEDGIVTFSAVKSKIIGELSVSNSVNLEDTLSVAKATYIAETLSVTGNTTAGGTLTVTGASTMNSTLEVNGDTTLNSDVTVADTKATVLGGTLQVKEATTLDDSLTVADTKATVLGGTLQVKEATTLDDSLTVADTKATVLGGTLQVKEGVTLDDTLDVANDTNITGDLTVGTQGTTTKAAVINGTLYVKDTAQIDSVLSVGADTKLSGNLNILGNTTTAGTLTVADSNATVLGGTLQVKEATTLDDTLTVATSKTTTLGGILSVSGATKLDDTLTVADTKATVLGGTLQVKEATTLDDTLTVGVNKATNLGGSLDVDGLAQFNNALTVGTGNVPADSTLNGDLNVSGNTTLTGTLSVDGNTNTAGTFTVAPSQTTTLGGILSVGGHTKLNDTLTVNTGKATILGGSLNVVGTTTLEDPLIVNTGNSTKLGDILSVTGATNIGSTLSVGGHTKLNETLTVNTGKATNLGGTLTVSGVTTLNNPVNVTGTHNTTLGGILSVGGDTKLLNKLSVGGDTSLGNKLSVNGNTNITGTLSINGNTTLSGILSVGSHTKLNETLTVNTGKTTNLGGALNVLNNNDTKLTGDLSVGGQSRLSGLLSITGNTNTAGTLNVAPSRATTLGGTLNVAQTTTLAQILSVGGHTKLNETLTVNTGKATNLGGTLTVGQKSTLNGQLEVTGTNSSTLGGTLTVGGKSTLNGQLEVTGTNSTTLGGTLTVTGNTQLNNDVTVALNKTTRMGGILSVSGDTKLDKTIAVGGIASLGSNLSVAGNTKIIGTLSVGNDFETSGNFTVAGTQPSKLTGTLSVIGATTLGNTLTVAANKATNLGGSLDVDGTSQFNDDLTVGTGNVSADSILNGDLSVSGDTKLGGILSVDSNTNIDGNMTVVGITHLNNELRVGTDLTNRSTKLKGTLSVKSGINTQSTLEVDGATELNSTLSIGNNTNTQGTLDVNGDTKLKSTLSITGNTNTTGTLTVGTTAVNKATALNGTLSITGDTNTSGTLTVGTTAVNKATTLKGTLLVTGTTQLEDELTVGTNLNNKATSLKGTLSVTGNTNTAGTLTVTGTTQLDDNLTVGSQGNHKTTTLFGTLSVHGNTNTDGTLTVDGTSQFYDDITIGTDINNKATSLKGTLSVTGNTNTDGALTVTGTTQLDDNLTVGSQGNHKTATLFGTLSVHGNTNTDGTLTVDGTTQLNDDLTVGTDINNKATSLKGTLSVTGNTNTDGTLTVTGTTSLNSTLSVTGNTNTDGTLTVDGTSQFYDDLTVGTDINNKATSLKGTLSVTGNTNTAGALTVTGTTQLDDNLTVGSQGNHKTATLFGTLSVHGNTNTEGTLTVDGTTQLNNDLTVGTDINNKATLLKGTLSVTGNTNTDGTLTVTGTTTLNSTLSVTGNTNTDGTLTVDGTSQFNDDLTVGTDINNKATSLKGTLSVTDNAYLEGTLSVFGLTNINSNLSVSGYIKTDNTLYIKSNGWVKEAINNENTELYYSDAAIENNGGILVENIDVNRNTYLKNINGKCIVKLQYSNDSGATWSNYKDSNSNDILIIFNNLIESDIIMFDKLYLNAQNTLEMFYADYTGNSLLDGNMPAMATGNQLKINNNDNSLDTAGAGDIDSLLFQSINDKTTNINSLKGDHNSRYLNTDESLYILINHSYLTVDADGFGALGTLDNAARFRIVEPSYSAQLDSQLSNNEIGAINKYGLQTSSRDVVINSDFKVFDKFTGDKYITVSSLRNGDIFDDENEKDNRSHHISFDKDVLVADTIDFKNTITDESPGLEKKYNIMLIKDANDVYNAQLNICEGNTVANKLEITTDNIGSTTNLYRVKIGTSQVINNIELLSTPQAYSDQKPLLCYGDRVKLYHFDNTDKHYLAIYDLNNDTNITTSFQNTKQILSYSSTSGLTALRLTDEFYLYPSKLADLGKPIEIKQNLSAESLTDQIYIKYYENGQLKDIHIDGANSSTNRYLEYSVNIITDEETPVFNLEYNSTSVHKKVSKNVTFHKDTNNYSSGLELQKSTFVGINPNSIDKDKASGLYNSSLIVGSGNGLSDGLRLNTQLNAHSLFIFNNAPQSNVLATQSVTINNTSSTSYTANINDYKLNTIDIKMGTYDQMSSEPGQMKMKVTDYPNKIGNNIYSSGLLDISMKKNSSWNDSVMKLNSKGDISIKGGLHQYDSSLVLEAGFSQSKRETVAGKLFAHAYVGDKVINQISVSGLGDPVFSTVFNQYIYSLGKLNDAGTDIVQITGATGQSIITNFDSHATDSAIDGTKTMYFGEIAGQVSNSDGGIDLTPGKVSFQAKIKIDTVEGSSTNGQIFLIPSTIKFVDRSFGRNTSDDIICVNAVMNNTKHHPFYSSTEYAADSDIRLAIKIRPITLVEGGIFTIRRDSEFPNNRTDAADTWYKPGYSTPNEAPLLQITGKSYILTPNSTSTNKFIKLEDLYSETGKTYYHQLLGEKAVFETITNETRVYDIADHLYNDFNGTLASDEVYVFGSSATSNNAKGYATSFINNPGINYLYQNDLTSIGVNSYDNFVYNTTNVHNLGQNVYGIGSQTFDIVAPMSTTDFRGYILLTNNSFDVNGTSTNSTTLSLNANNDDSILGGSSTNITKVGPYLINQSRFPGSIQVKTYSTDNTETVLRIVWDGRPIVIKNELNVFYQDILIDIMANAYTRDAIQNNIKDYIYIPVTVIHSQDSTLSQGDYYYGGPGATDGSGKCKFVVAYDIKSTLDSSKEDFLKSISPDNINNTNGTSTSEDKFWENIDNIEILSMNNKSEDQIIDFNETNEVSDVFMIKVNVGFPVKFMEVIRIAKYTSTGNKLTDNLLSSSRFKF